MGSCSFISPPTSSHSPKTWGKWWIGYFRLTLGVKGCRSLCQPCCEQVMYPGFSLPHQRQLGWALLWRTVEVIYQIIAKIQSFSPCAVIRARKLRRYGQSERFRWVILLDRSVCLLPPKIERPLSELWDLCVSNGSHVTEQLILLHFNLWPARVTSSVLTSSPPQVFSYHFLFEAVKDQHPRMNAWSSWVFFTHTPQEVVFSSEFISEMIDQQAPVFLLFIVSTTDMMDSNCHPLFNIIFLGLWNSSCILVVNVGFLCRRMRLRI